jgi:hypothetical protein
MRNKIKNAYREFLSQDCYLLEVKANERSLTHRFAVHVQSEFKDYHVDCEYNRDGHKPKRLKRFKKRVQSNSAKGVTAFPDIIVHRRGPGTGNNLVVIEAKTTLNKQDCTNGKDCPCDECKLRTYKDELGYQHAYFVLFPFGNDLKNYTEAKLNDYVVEV